MTPAFLRRTAAALGFLGVALGAFGAHALKDALAARGTTETWHTAVFYHLVHAVVLLVVSLRPKAHGAALFLAGIVIFSGSLYLYALTGWKPAAMVTPLGGLALLGGWLRLALAKDL